MKTKFNLTTIQRSAIFVFCILIYTSVFAQTEVTTKLKSKEFFTPQRLNLKPFSSNLQSNYFQNLFDQNHVNPTNASLRFKESALFTRVSFKQYKTENILPYFGGYEFFNNQLNFKVNNRTSMEFGLGLAKQNTILNPYKPNYQIGFQASVEFAVTSKLDAFIYGQYFTSPINKPKDFFDPMIYMNPLFLQSEVGAGLKRDYKYMNAKFQINSIYDNQSKQFAPVNSKISIGF